METRDRTITYVFVSFALAFTLGFVLPVCSCVGAGALVLNALGSLIEGTETEAVGFGDAVAVIRLDGVIAGSSVDPLGTTGITPARVDELLAQAGTDPTIKSVVVRVDSPGGSVVASNLIYHALLEFEKPVVVWMGETAASGGYYISCGADYVFAHPDTLTGSIGVISQFFNVDELLEEVGVDVVVIATGPRKDIGSLFRDMTEEEQALWEEIIDDAYEGFVEIVAEARDLPVAGVRDLADGSVYTGRQALELGLVDELGLPADAITRAAELGGISGEPRVVELETTPTLIETLYGFQSRPALPALEEILDLAGVPGIEFRFSAP
jgi:protease-4